MGIFSRITDIANSNIVHILDKAEDPEKMVRLMIGEMEDTLVEVKTTAAKGLSEEKELERQIEGIVQSEKDWQQKAELAVSKDRDDLARGALAEKAKLGERKKVLEEQLEAVKEGSKKFKEDIRALQEKLTDARDRQKQILARKRNAQAQLNIHKTLDRSVKKGAIQKFEHFEREIGRMESQLEIDKMSSKEQDLQSEFAKLEQDSLVEEQLAQLKKKMGSSEPVEAGKGS